MTASPGLSYVALVSRDVPAACGVLGGVLGLRRTDCALGGDTVPVFAVGEAALALFEPGDPFVHGTDRTGVHHIGLTVDDVDGTTARLAAAGISAR
ncbi:MAG: VOC family protein, partial [Rhodospirillales bacterium]